MKARGGLGRTLELDVACLAFLVVPRMVYVEAEIYGCSVASALSWFALAPDLPLRNLPSENERNLLLRYVTEARGNVAGALECFRRVRGRAQIRAQAEISRLTSQRGATTRQPVESPRLERGLRRPARTANPA
jgi:hypothetical protein